MSVVINCHQLSSIVINCHQLSSIIINCHQSSSLNHWVFSKVLNLEKLSERRNRLCLKFAKKSIKHEKAKKFPVNVSRKNFRKSERCKVNFANTNRYQKSTIPFLQNLLIDEQKRKKWILKNLWNEISIYTRDL